MTQYGRLAGPEQEVTIRLHRETGKAHICSTWPAWSRKLERRYGPPKRETERDGKVTSAFWIIPLRLVVFRRPLVERPQTEAQRLAQSRFSARNTVRRPGFFDRSCNARPKGLGPRDSEDFSGTTGVPE